MPVTSKKPAKLRRSQGERSEASRASLIESAIRHTRERGLAAVSLADIAADAKLSRGAIQHHFSSRAELILAAISELDRRICVALEAYTAPDDVAGVDRVAVIFDHVIALADSSDVVAAYDLWSASRSDPALSHRTAELQRQLTDQFRTFWRRNLEGHMPPALVEMSLDITLMINQGAAMSQLLRHASGDTKRTLLEAKAMLLEFIGGRLGQG